jgi:nuclear GTP-binding protein
VGVIGYPNVGKSSLINSLKRCKSVGVSPTPGFTKAMQEIQLDRYSRLPLWLHSFCMQHQVTCVQH